MDSFGNILPLFRHELLTVSSVFHNIKHHRQVSTYLPEITIPMKNLILPDIMM
jgi:hypothetical protein